MNQLRSARILVLAATAALLGAGFVACSDDDDDAGDPAATVTSGLGDGGGGDATATSEGDDGGTTPEPATSPAATTEPTTAAGETPAPTSAAPNGSVISVQEAIAIARQEAEGEVLDIDAGLDDGAISYEIEIGSMSIVIDAATGDILAVTEDRGDDDDDEIHEPVTFPEDAISPLEAIAIAEEMSGGIAEDLEIDDVGGTPVYVVEAGDVEYSIDVVSGEVVEIDD